MSPLQQKAFDHTRPRPRAGARGRVALLLAAPADEKLWRTALASQEVASIDGNLAPSLASALRDDVRMATASAMIVDMPLIHAAGLSVERLCEWVGRGFPGLALYVRLPWRVSISRGEQAWARRVGLAGMLPGESMADWGGSLAPSLSLVLQRLGGPDTDMQRLGTSLRALLAGGDEPRPGPVKDAVVLARRIEQMDADPEAILAGMKTVLDVSDRRYRGRAYRQCFVASSAIGWLESEYGLPRHAGSTVCEYLWRTGRLHHVVREQPFADEELFFRFSGDAARLDRIDLHTLQQEMRGARGVAISSRSHLGTTYPRVFTGTDAVDWLMQRHRLDVGEAEAIGQRWLDIGIIHHVVDEHGFSDAPYYYRFRRDER